MGTHVDISRVSSGGHGAFVIDRQLTSSPHGHLLTNIGVWSPDGNWIVYDVRSDAAGSVFDGRRIEKVNVQTGEVVVLYESRHGAHCGVATYSPVEDKVAFIHGPEHPTPDWQYGPSRRRGVMVDGTRPGVAVNLDACDLAPPFTPGALRGGSHVHVFSGDGRWVSFTYNDEILSRIDKPLPGGDIDQRNVGVCIPAGPVRVSRGHPHNHDGAWFSVLVTRTTSDPRAGSDDITKAFEDAWVGESGYIKADGSHQSRAIAFQGDVITEKGETISEVFIADLPNDLTIPGDGPLQGTVTRRPFSPKSVTQRRLTRTAGRGYPGIQGPRHWLRSAPDGSRIAFLMRDDSGIVQIWTVSPDGGEPVQRTRNPWDIASTFTWSPDGRWLAHAMDNSIFVTDAATGHSVRLTPKCSDESAPRPEAVVFSPDGGTIAYVRRVIAGEATYNQIFVVSFQGDSIS
jgi:hypothetical protein